jgi:hypothetical protein
VRELAVLHPVLARRYDSVVAEIAPRIERGLSSCVLANRVAGSPTAPPWVRLGAWKQERAAFARRLSALGRESPCLVFADVRDCYGSIAPDVVVASLRLLGCGEGPTRRVGDLLAHLVARGERGLPVGPPSSAVLANAVLARVDRALRREGIRHLRWVDDVVAAADGPERAGWILEVIRTCLGELGLELNETKTRFVMDPTGRAADLAVSGARATGIVG